MADLPTTGGCVQGMRVGFLPQPLRLPDRSHGVVQAQVLLHSTHPCFTCLGLMFTGTAVTAGSGSSAVSGTAQVQAHLLPGMNRAGQDCAGGQASQGPSTLSIPWQQTGHRQGMHLLLALMH